jgi:N-acetylglutamate synthase-like GNAT family acetyltransferase
MLGPLAGCYGSAVSQGFAIRPATETDARAIRRLVSEAQLNPRDLDWHRFLVADAEGAVVACAQVRIHGRGSRELASVAVTEARRGAGVGRAISEAAIARERTRPLYLFTERGTVAFWRKFAYREVEDPDVPADMRGALRIARVATKVVSVLMRRQIRIVVMRRDEA